MTWRNEQPDNSPPPKPAERPAIVLCKALTFVFLALAIYSSVASLYSLSTLHGCTQEQLSHIAVHEFKHVVVWPLVAAVLSFFVWRLLKGRGGAT